MIAIVRKLVSTSCFGVQSLKKICRRETLSEIQIIPLLEDHILGMKTMAKTEEETVARK